MAAEKAAPLPLSAVSVSVSVSVEEEGKHAPAADPPFLPGVRDAIIWALFNAGWALLSIAYGVIVTSISHQVSRPRPAAEPEKVTDAEIHTGLMAAMLWCVCVVSQAAAGSLALALPRRHRLLLAYAALVATAAGHCIWAGLYIMFVAPGALSFWIGVNTAVIFAGVVDILCFRAFSSVEGRMSRDLRYGPAS